MRPIISLFLLLCITIAPIYAQKGDILLTNSRNVVEDRYEGIKGSPYAFKEWHPATIISTEADITEVAAINYNAYTHNLEVKKGTQFIELDPAWYVRVIIHVADTADEVRSQKSDRKINFSVRSQIYDVELDVGVHVINLTSDSQCN